MAKNPRHTEHSGYVQITEGMVRKGGQNMSPKTQVPVRPPPPAPMRPQSSGGWSTVKSPQNRER